jgi:hypothetical protein
MAAISAEYRAQLSDWRSTTPSDVVDALWRGARVGAKESFDESLRGKTMGRLVENTGVPPDVLRAVLQDDELLHELAPGIDASPAEFLSAWQDRTPPNVAKKLWHDAIHGDGFDEGLRSRTVARIALEAGVSSNEVRSVLPLVEGDRL